MAKTVIVSAAETTRDSARSISSLVVLAPKDVLCIVREQSVVFAFVLAARLSYALRITRLTGPVRLMT